MQQQTASCVTGLARQLCIVLVPAHNEMLASARLHSCCRVAFLQAVRNHARLPVPLQAALRPTHMCC